MAVRGEGGNARKSDDSTTCAACAGDASAADASRLAAARFSLGDGGHEMIAASGDIRAPLLVSAVNCRRGSGLASVASALPLALRCSPPTASLPGKAVSSESPRAHVVDEVVA